MPTTHSTSPLDEETDRPAQAVEPMRSMASAAERIAHTDTINPRDLAKLVAALDPQQRKQFESAERLTRVNGMSSDEIDADIREKAKGKFAGARVASAIKPTSITWLWQDYVPLGALSLLYGQEGDGKSTLTMMLAAMATQGTLPGALYGKPSSVEIIAYEDDAGAVLVPRLLAAGADLDYVYIHGDDAGDGLLTLPDDVGSFSAALEDRGSKLVIIDPLPDALREGLKDNNNGDVRKGIVPLHRMAQELGTAVLGVTHPNKGSSDAANKVMGSKAWRSVPRAVLIYGRDPDDLNGPTRVVAVSKANYAGKSSRRVKIESVGVDGVEHPQPRAEIAGATEYTDADLIVASVGAAKGGPVKEQTQVERAEALLYRLLEHGGGEIDAKTAYVAGDAEGIPEATMRRARQNIGATGGRTWKLEGLGL